MRADCSLLIEGVAPQHAHYAAKHGTNRQQPAVVEWWSWMSETSKQSPSAPGYWIDTLVIVKVVASKMVAYPSRPWQQAWSVVG